MYKYPEIHQTKGDFVFKKNERAAEATRRPTATQLQYKDSVAILAVFVTLTAALALAAEHLLGSIGFYWWW